VLSFFSSSSSKISLVFLWFLLEGEVLSNKIEAGILTLLLLVRAKKVLVLSHHTFHSFLSPTENVLRVFGKLMQLSRSADKSLVFCL